MSKRKSKKFWVINDCVVSEEIGYECPPNDDMWWFPSKGFSTHEDNTFKTEKEAKKVAIRNCDKNIAHYQSLKEKLINN